MKLFRISILFLSLLFFNQSVFAQGYRLPQRGQRGYIPPSTQGSTGAYKAGPKDASTIVEEQMPTYIVELKLDAFKEEVLKSLLIQYYTKREPIQSDYSIEYTDRQDILLKLEEELHTELTTILSPEELEGFKNIHFLDAKEKKKKIKEKKKKDKKKSKGKKEKGTH